MKKWLFNPFIYVAGGKSLAIGQAAILVAAIIGFFSGSHFDGVLDMHKSHMAMRWYAGLLEAETDWVAISVLTYVAGSIFSASAIRIIDVAGTQAMARWPMILAAIVNFFVVIPDHLGRMNTDDLMQMITPQFIGCAVAAVVLVVWMVALMYHAFSVSCNLKGARGAGIFITALIIAEVASKVVFYYAYNK